MSAVLGTKLGLDHKSTTFVFSGPTAHQSSAESPQAGRLSENRIRSFPQRRLGLQTVSCNSRGCRWSVPLLLRSRSPPAALEHSVLNTQHTRSLGFCMLFPAPGKLFLFCLRLFWLLYQNTIDWVACKQQKFIASRSGGWHLRSECRLGWVRTLFQAGDLSLYPHMVEGIGGGTGVVLRDLLY